MIKPSLIAWYKGPENPRLLPVVERQTWGFWTPITDHNRGPLDVSVERIENSQRMVNGTMRKYYITDKRSYSLSWEMVPGPSVFRNSNGKEANATVDGYWGADQMEDFYFRTPGEFDMLVTYGKPKNSDPRSPDYKVFEKFDIKKVMFKEFSKSLQKRGVHDFYSLNISLEEV